MSKRKNAVIRKEQILREAIKLLIKGDLTRDKLAAKCKVSCGLISHHFGGMVNLRKLTIDEGVKLRHHKVILIGLAENNLAARKLPPYVKQACVSI